MYKKGFPKVEPTILHCFLTQPSLSGWPCCALLASGVSGLVSVLGFMSSVLACSIVLIRTVAVGQR
jgi:hypothetical protein